MSEYTNGAAVVDLGRLRGRAAPDFPVKTLPSGYTVQCRRMAAGVAAQLNAQAYKELESERPAAPVQTVTIGPGERPGEPERTAEVTRESDPEYQQAVGEWEDRVKRAGAMKLLKLIQNYALLTPTDAEAVAAYREAMTAVGLPVPDDDREIFVWSIVAPSPDDQQALVMFVLGISEAQQEAIQAQKRAFRGDVPREADQPLPDAGRAGQL